MALIASPLRATPDVPTKGCKFTWTLEGNYDSLITERFISDDFQACGQTWFLEFSTPAESKTRIAVSLHCQDVAGEIYVFTNLRNTFGVTFTEKSTFNKKCRSRVIAFTTKDKLKEWLGNGKKLNISVELFVQHAHNVGVQVARDLGKLLFEEASCDVKFLFGEEHLSGHSLVLSARSTVFAVMLSSGMVEGKTKVVLITDVNKAVFSVLLEYIYTDDISTENLAKYKYKILMLAEKYNLPGLKAICEYFLLETVYLDNACKIFSCADKFNMPLARATMLKFIAAHPVDVIKSKGFGKLIGQYPALAMEIQQLFANQGLAEERIRKKVQLE